MTSKQWVDYVKLHLGEIDPTNTYHKEFVKLALSVSWENLVFDTYRRTPYELDSLTKSYGDEGTPLVVSHNNNTGEYYTSLPSSIVILDRVGSGVIEVSTLQGQAVTFVPVSSYEKRISRNVEVASVVSTIPYCVEDKKVVYASMNNDIVNAGVRMKLVVPFDSYSSDEHVPIPAGQTQRFLESVLSTLGIVIDEELVNNNTNIRSNGRPTSAGNN
jgi:hypothetical protein